ncbi:MAG: TIGR00730 family Rossman fold protein [Candidatus Cyclobacteriaceae bacterium M3_2C_046]
MERICVFCGSKKGKDPVFEEQARILGQIMAGRNYTLVYGGGGIGLMGVLADEVIHLGGRVIGVIPRFLSDRELGHDNLTELILVDSMHQRKQKMAELADAFIALPGGYGTLEELCEILTWRQLSLIQKPIGLLNMNGYFDHLVKLFDTMVEQEFLSVANQNLIKVEKDPVILIDKLSHPILQTNQDIDKT